MPTRRDFRRGLFPIFVAMIVATLVMPLGVSAAAGSSGAVQQAGVGAYVTFTGSGFQAGEQVSLWANDPSGNTTPIDGTLADGSGAISISVSFPSAGMWQVTAHGNTSGVEFVGQYSVGTSTTSLVPPTSSTTTSPPTATSTTTGSTSSATSASAPSGLPPGTSVVSSGTTVTFSGSGFNNGETINIWTTAPDNTTAALPTISADGSGGANGSTAFSVGGLWQVTMHGKDSGHEVVSRFYVSGAAAAGTTTTNTTNTTTKTSTTPSGNVPAGLPPGTATTAPGSTISFSGNGFNGNEAIGIWETAPDSTVTRLPAGFADGSGSFAGSTAFGTAGLWQITIHGKDSGHEVINRFYVTGNASSSTTTGTTTTTTASANSNTSVVKVQASQHVTFTVSGFTANEIVSVWTTSPEGTVAALDTTQANNLGRVAITTTFPSAGLWQITAHGQSSGYETVGQYQVSASA